MVQSLINTKSLTGSKASKGLTKKITGKLRPEANKFKNVKTQGTLEIKKHQEQ